MILQRITATAVFFLFSVSLFGQNLSSVNGLVTDPSGAVIAGASLELRNLSTQAVRRVTSDTEGRYNIPQVQPGKYQLVAKASGFADIQVNNVILEVNVPATINIAFEKVGSVAETISISAESIQVNTTDASIGNVIQHQAIVELPLFARNVAQLLSYQPGVNELGNVNGGKSDQGNITLDGIDVNDQQDRTAFTSVLRVTPDSIQEFRTTTANANAELGRTSGAQIALVTRSGTNDIHGAVYDLHRNTATSANTFFNNQAGVKRPALLIDVFGGAILGPVKKNKAFFFLNYEGRRDRSAENVLRTVPSAEMRQGIVQYRTTGGAVAQVGPADIRARIDPARIGPSPGSLQLLQSYPLPNDFTVGDGLNIVGHRFTAGRHAKEDTYIAKFDVNLSQKHTFYARGNLQNDREGGVPQYPGDPPRQVFLDNNKGFAVGLTSVLKSNLISTLRYGLTRQGTETTGIQTGPIVSFRNLDTRFANTRGISRIIPVHNITQDFAWTKGAHDLRIGGTLRWTEAKSINFARAWSSASANLSWLRGTGTDLQTGVPDLATTFRVAYGDAMMAVLGIITQGNGIYNYDIQGNVLAAGDPVRRRFRNEEYEWYIQDTWRVTRGLTLTYGLRHSLMPPVYEADGVQTSATFSMGEWFNTRGGLADAGRSQKEAGLVEYVLHNDPRGRPLYAYHKKNFAPRFSIAYSPQGDGRLSRFLFGGPGKTSIRAGIGMFYDLFGQGIIRTFDASAFGLSTTLTNPSGQVTSTTAPRFTGFNNLPTELIRVAPKGGFPQLHPTSGAGSFAITNFIDDTIRPPYTLPMNISIGREFRGGFYIQGAYVGRGSRRSIIDRDLAMPTNPTDPGSGQSYYDAATVLARHILAGTPTAQVPRIPFFENFWSNAAASGRTATQNIYANWSDYGPDFLSGLADMDHFDFPTCSRLGCNFMFSNQLSSLSARSSVAGGSFHSMQWTARKRFGAGLTLDFNYTWAKSLDLASANENAGAFSLVGSSGGFLLNPWFPMLRKGVSDYDQTHIWNGFADWELPVGKGKKWGAGLSGPANALLGGWQIATAWQQSTEFPLSVGNGRNWPTNWNLTGLATPIKTPPTPNTTKNAPAVAGRGGPNVFSDPKAALDSYGFTLPGGTGSRNTLRGDGRFAINLGVKKRFVMPYNENHRVQFRWETFNLTNAVNFSNSSVTMDLGNTGNFGKFSATSIGSREMQFTLRYEF